MDRGLFAPMPKTTKTGKLEERAETAPERCAASSPSPFALRHNKRLQSRKTIADPLGSCKSTRWLGRHQIRLPSASQPGFLGSGSLAFPTSQPHDRAEELTTSEINELGGQRRGFETACTMFRKGCSRNPAPPRTRPEASGLEPARAPVRLSQGAAQPNSRLRGKTPGRGLIKGQRVAKSRLYGSRMSCTTRIRRNAYFAGHALGSGSFHP